MLLHFSLVLFLFLFLNSLLCFQVQSITQAQSHRPNITAAADAPAPASPAAPAADTRKIDLIAVMSKKGCKTFADLLTAGKGTDEVAKSFEDSIDGGLTVFCPIDQAMKSFLPKFKNLTADERASLLLYHGVPVYYSIDALKSSNGVMNTLATDGVAKNFNFTVSNNGEIVTLKTAGDTASIKSTIVDKDPLAVYSIDEVLEPAELFKPAEVPAPAPAPEAVADAPTAGKKKKKHAKAAPAPAGPAGEPADQKAADDNAGCRIYFQWSAAVAAAATILVFLDFI